MHSYIFIVENKYSIAFSNFNVKYISSEKKIELSYHNYVASSLSCPIMHEFHPYIQGKVFKILFKLYFLGQTNN